MNGMLLAAGEEGNTPIHSRIFGETLDSKISDMIKTNKTTNSRVLNIINQTQKGSIKNRDRSMGNAQAKYNNSKLKSDGVRLLDQSMNSSNAHALLAKNITSI